MTAAVDLVAKTTERTVELAPAVMRDGVQRPAVLGLGWWQVASAAAMTGSEAASAMAEAVAVMVVASATALAVGRSLLDGVLADSDPTSLPSNPFCCSASHFFIPSNPFCSHLRTRSAVGPSKKEYKSMHILLKPTVLHQAGGTV